MNLTQYLSTRPFVYSSRCACLWPLDTCVTHSRSHGQMDGWTDGQIDEQKKNLYCFLTWCKGLMVFYLCNVFRVFAIIKYLNLI